MPFHVLPKSWKAKKRVEMVSLGKYPSKLALALWHPCTVSFRFGPFSPSELNCGHRIQQIYLFQNAPELVNEDIVRRLSAPLEGAWAPLEGAMMLLGQAPTLLKSYASELRALLAMLRLRLFEVLALLPPVSLESNFAALLRLLVCIFALISY